MTTLTQTTASQLETGNRVCGDYGVTYTAERVEVFGDRVNVTWHTGRTVSVPTDEVFYVDARKGW